jgi:hypothetical protein
LNHLNAKLKLEIIGLSSPDLASTPYTCGNLTEATRHAVFLITFPLILLACVVVTVVRILALDFEDAVEKVNKSQLSAAVRLPHPSREVERFDVIVEETVGNKEVFQPQIATLQVELFLQKLVTGDNLEKLETLEEKNRERLMKLKAAQAEVIALKLEVEELGRKISEGKLRMRAAQQEIAKLIMKAEGQGETKGRAISTNKHCVEAAQKEIVKLKRELTEVRKSHK